MKRICRALLVAGAAAALAWSGMAWAEEEPSCEERCHEEERRCYEACTDPGDADACEDVCDVASADCLELCE